MSWIISTTTIMITARQRDFIFLMGRWTIWLVLLLFIICYTTWYKNDKNFRFCFVIFLRISVFNLSIPQRCYNMSGKVTNDNRLRYFWDFEVLKRSEKWQEFVTIIPSKNIDNKRWENEIGLEYIFTYRYKEMFARNVSISTKTSQIDFSIQCHYIEALFTKRFMALLLKLHQIIMITCRIS